MPLPRMKFGKAESPLEGIGFLRGAVSCRNRDVKRTSEKKDENVNKKMMVVLLLVVFALAACDKEAADTTATTTETAAQAKPDPVMVRVNGGEIRESEFVAAMESIPAQMRSALASPSGKKVLAEELVRMKVLELEGEKMGLEKDPEIASRIAMARGNILANGALEKLATGSNMTPEQIYEKSKSQFETIKARQIVIPVIAGAEATGPNALPPAQAKAKADAIVAQLRGGADFAAIAKKESADPNSASKGGDLGELTRGMLPPDIAKQVFSLPVNQVSAPIESRLGYHIFQVTGKTVKSFDEVRTYIEQQGDKIKAEQIIEDLRQKAQVEFVPEFFPAAGAPSAQPQPQPQ